jgi:uncharacterized protein (TIGR02444 family)
MTAPPLQLDNAFWRFSLAVYGAPGVAAECLALQEALEIDVNLLLFYAWLGAARRVSLTAGDIERARLLVQSWHAEAVRPLRSVRRRLKSFSSPESEALRTRVKAIELDAEQVEQAMLFAHAQECWPPAGGGDPRKIVPDNVRIFLLQAGTSTHGTALSTQRLVDAALAERADRPDN